MLLCLVTYDVQPLINEHDDDDDDEFRVYAVFTHSLSASATHDWSTNLAELVFLPWFFNGFSTQSINNNKLWCLIGGDVA